MAEVEVEAEAAFEVVSERRAETEVMPAAPCDHTEHEACAESQQCASDSCEAAVAESRCENRSIDACDRALDTASLFDGFSDDRWIETRARS